MYIKNKIKLLIFLFLISITFYIPNYLSIGASSSVYIGGDNIGMELNGNGLIVSNTTTIHYDEITYNPSKDDDIQIGDLIVEIDNKEVKSMNDLEEIIKEFDQDINRVNIKILRNNKKLNKKLSIYKIDNVFKTGLFIKEKILGIGTITFIDPKTSKYAALGHEVRDSDYKEIYPISGGTIYESNVTGIKSSSNGDPGEKIAQINKKSEIGTINKNTIYGIYGEYNNKITSKLIETSDIVKEGKAYIRTELDDNIIKDYEIEITEVREQKEKSTKGFSFKVTDNKLLEKTNGIIQGMSGSPVIQDNKLIGAVTHVIVDNCHYGHAIYIRFMIDELNNL